MFCTYLALWLFNYNHIVKDTSVAERRTLNEKGHDTVHREASLRGCDESLKSVQDKFSFHQPLYWTANRDSPNWWYVICLEQDRKGMLVWLVGFWLSTVWILDYTTAPFFIFWVIVELQWWCIYLWSITSHPEANISGLAEIANFTVGKDDIGDRIPLFLYLIYHMILSHWQWIYMKFQSKLNAEILYNMVIGEQVGWTKNKSRSIRITKLCTMGIKCLEEKIFKWEFWY